jgi:hypothetical protein
LTRRFFIRLSGTVIITGATGPVVSRDRRRDKTPNDQAILITQTRTLLGSLKSAALSPFLSEWPVAPRRAAGVSRDTLRSAPVMADQRVIVPSSVPVVRWLPQVRTGAPAFSSRVVAELCRVAPGMAWHRTYKVPDVSEVFLDNYGWSEIVGLTGQLPSTRIACGFLLLGPATEYPLHRHEAEEIYIPLAGVASWQQGEGVWREQQPGTVIHHASNEPHGMRTGAQPLLALYLWRSANLDQKAHLLGR